MPTGYTADVQSGKITKFSDFALLCARAFGALVTMREDSLDTPIPEEFTPDDDEYRKRAIKRIKQDIEKYTTISDKNLELEITKEYDDAIKHHNEILVKKTEDRAKYEAMLEKVNQWSPPTSDHIGLKDFMIEQLNSSIEFDTNTSYYDENPPKLLDVTTYRKQKLNELEKNLQYHVDELNKENIRVTERNLWIKNLRNSLILPDVKEDPANAASTQKSTT